MQLWVMNLLDYLDLNDNIIEVDLTPNRADCLSIRGLAREVGVLNCEPVKQLDIVAVQASIKDSSTAVIEAPQGLRSLRGTHCPRGRFNAPHATLDARALASQWN